MQLLFQLIGLFLATSLATLSLYYFLRLSVRQVIRNQHDRSRSETRLYRPKIGHVYVFCILGSSTVVLAAYLFLGNPAFGLPLIPLICVLALPIFSLQQESKLFRNERAAINFLHGLHGLIQGGLSLPAALISLSEGHNGEIGAAIQGRLKSFPKGESLVGILEESRHLLGLRRLDTCLSALGMAYEKGLPIGPILATSLPNLESEAEMFQRIREIRKSITIQAALACILPWALVAFINLFQPETAAYFITAWTPVWIGLGVAWYGFGVFVLWIVSEFY